MTESAAQVSKTIDAPPEAVWKALTNPSSLKQFFFGADVESDFKVGHPIRMKGSFKGKSYEDKGEILEVKPNARLSFSHWSAMSGTVDAPQNYHVVCLDLAPHSDGTNVTLTQGNLMGGLTDSDRKHKSEYEKNWRMLLDGLAKVVTKMG